MMPRDPDYPALLDVGFHDVSLRDILRLCVESFPASQSRFLIYRELTQMVARLSHAGIVGELWVNGSFLTFKPNPADVDVLLYVKTIKGITLDAEQRDALFWFMQECRQSGLCDTNLLQEQIVPAGHPPLRRQWLDLWNKALWIRQFGFGRGRDVKGIAVLRLPPPQEGN